MSLTVGSLFSGIGGLDLGLERAGMRVIWQSEIDPYASRVLAKHWPEVPNHGDITRLSWADVVRPDVVCGGYPCQPFSKAGKRRGENDPRHLWPYVREAIGDLRPRYAILENVRGHLSLGGVSVIGDLADLGYSSEWRIVSAASVGAPHQRERVIILAYSDSGHASDGGKCSYVSSLDSGGSHDGNRGSSDTRQVTLGESREDSGALADPDSLRRMDSRTEIFPTDGRFPSFAQPAIRGWWETEPDVGRVAHGVPDRVDRLRGLGNAVVPQVAEVIGRLVLEHYSRTEAAYD